MHPCLTPSVNHKGLDKPLHNRTLILSLKYMEWIRALTRPPNPKESSFRYISSLSHASRFICRNASLCCSICNRSPSASLLLCSSCQNRSSSRRCRSSSRRLSSSCCRCSSSLWRSRSSSCRLSSSCCCRRFLSCRSQSSSRRSASASLAR